MAIIKISELTELTTLADGDQLVVNDISEEVDANKTKRISGVNLLARVLAVAEAALALVKRQGGSTSDWATNGTTDYTPSGAFVQAGVIRVSITPNQSYVDVTLPQAYSKKPLVFTNLIYDDAIAASYAHNCWGYALSASAIRVYGTTFGSVSIVLDIAWMTIGE